MQGLVLGALFIGGAAGAGGAAAAIMAELHWLIAFLIYSLGGAAAAVLAASLAALRRGPRAAPRRPGGLVGDAS